MKKTVSAVWLGLLLVCSQANAATQQQIDQAWNKGLAWMMLQQRGDGGWSDSSGLGPQATAEFVNALSSINLTVNYTFLGGLSWLGHVETASVDALSRQTGALTTARANPLALATKLLAWRNAKNAWGAYPQYETSLPDTPLAIVALMDAMGSSFSNTDLAAAACQFLPAQLPSPDYLWPYSANAATGATLPTGQRVGAIAPTVHAVLALRKINAERLTSLSCGTTYSLATVIDHAVTGLLAKGKGDNGFGDNDVSTVAETALVYRVLKALRPTDAATGSALDYLVARQAANGSWGDSVYFSALVLASLPAPSPAALVDTDQDGIPDGVELVLGTNPLVADSRFLATVNDPRFFDADTPQILSITRN